VEIAPSIARSNKDTLASLAVAFVAAGAVVGAETAISFFVLDHRLADVVMVYLLGVVLVAMRFGYAPSLFTAAASVAAFDFFFTVPYFSFAVTDKRYVLTFAIMFFVAFVISNRTERIRRIASMAREREVTTARLYAMSRELAVAR
jgi:two-component system, OmpR family, sensor histidine kinase KdpD